jgi:hypothetical protein
LGLPVMYEFCQQHHYKGAGNGPEGGRAAWTGGREQGGSRQGKRECPEDGEEGGKGREEDGRWTAENGRYYVRGNESQGGHQKERGLIRSGGTKCQHKDGQGEDRGRHCRVREDLQGNKSKLEEKRHQVLSQDWRKRNREEAHVVGMSSEQVKTELLDAARELQLTAYKNISIGPDQTRKQRQAEKKLQEEVERKNREELSEEDLSKNLKWQAVGRKGEKRIVKAPEREREHGEKDPPATTRGGGGEDEGVQDRAGGDRNKRRRSTTETAKEARQGAEERDEERDRTGGGKATRGWTWIWKTGRAGHRRGTEESSRSRTRGGHLDRIGG